MTTIDEIIENFAVLDDWDDRYRYVIELGRMLPPLPEADHVEANKVRGCASQVWLVTTVQPDGAAGPTLHFEGDSAAMTGTFVSHRAIPASWNLGRKYKASVGGPVNFPVPANRG